MKISKLRNLKTASSVKKSKNPGEVSNHFSDQLKGIDSIDSPGVLSESKGVTSVDVVLALQESDVELDERPRSIHRDYGLDLLDQLDQLRIGILAGVFSKERLADLARKLREKQKQTDDPNLNRIIKEIEFRAEVEIAKFTRTS
jgi:hypothetical protein